MNLRQVENHSLKKERLRTNQHLNRKGDKMRKGHILFLIVAVMLTLDFIASEVQAGVKVKVCFQIPDGVNIQRGLAVTRMSDGKKLFFQQSWNSNQVCYDNVQSGKRILYRFEWCPGTGFSSACTGMVAAQVVDVWQQFTKKLSGDGSCTCFGF